jgi:hypothetical protein
VVGNFDVASPYTPPIAGAAMQLLTLALPIMRMTGNTRTLRRVADFDPAGRLLEVALASLRGRVRLLPRAAVLVKAVIDRVSGLALPLRAAPVYWP